MTLSAICRAFDSTERGGGDIIISPSDFGRFSESTFSLQTVPMTVRTMTILWTVLPRETSQDCVSHFDSLLALLRLRFSLSDYGHGRSAAAASLPIMGRSFPATFQDFDPTADPISTTKPPASSARLSTRRARTYATPDSPSWSRRS
jgi:hypothetical protein